MKYKNYKADPVYRAWLYQKKRGLAVGEYEAFRGQVVAQGWEPGGVIRADKAGKITIRKQGRHVRYIDRRPTPLHLVWKNMNQRCNDAKHPAYGRYGGRGITICEAWGDYDAFADWALAHGWGEGLTIDRIDNEGPYTPENVRFVSLSENLRNRAATDKQRAAAAETCRIIGKMPSRSKPVRCIETGVTYPSASAVGRHCGISRKAVSAAIKRRSLSVGHHREYLA